MAGNCNHISICIEIRAFLYLRQHDVVGARCVFFSILIYHLSIEHRRQFELSRNDGVMILFRVSLLMICDTASLNKIIFKSKISTVRETPWTGKMRAETRAFKNITISVSRSPILGEASLVYYCRQIYHQYLITNSFKIPQICFLNIHICNVLSRILWPMFGHSGAAEGLWFVSAL